MDSYLLKQTMMQDASKLKSLRTSSTQSAKEQKQLRMRFARKANEKYITRANFNTNTASQGGSAVPEFWVEEIQNFADTYGYARALARIYPMRGKIENLTSSGAFVGAVIAEGSGLTLTDSSNFFTSTVLTAKKIAAGAIISEEQLQDATPAFLDYVVNGLGRALAETEDKQIL